MIFFRYIHLPCMSIQLLLARDPLHSKKFIIRELPPPPFFGGMYTVKSEVIIRKSTLKLKVEVSSNFLIVKIFLIRLPPFPNVSAKKFTTLVIILEVQI